MAIRLIVFDLDETLVHATEVPLPHPCDFQVGAYGVHVRPFASELIDFCASRCDVGVWSSAGGRYVEAVTERLFGAAVPVQFSWSVAKCVQRIDPKSNGYVYVKDLRRLMKHGYAVDEILMLDDSPGKLQRQPANHVHVPAFMGDLGDDALLDVIERVRSRLDGACRPPGR
jgi:RNA polymerase II subunit A small phosphatase-like protein